MFFIIFINVAYWLKFKLIFYISMLFFIIIENICNKNEFCLLIKDVCIANCKNGYIYKI